ncbi:uncharacterized protein LOC109719351 isoform X2 [Ananas comosus]|nr:uncharacterized protein LOC109719351 isoform X2 [Ananas comosus]
MQMARWDEILTLPVQNPPTLEFSAADITWSRVEGWRESMDRLALIPFTRVNDFVRGESNNKECPTRFHVEARRRRPREMAYKPKVDGILEYILYWCSFGPDDHRKGGVVRPSRNYTAKRKTPAGRPNTKRGCVCHFIVKRLIAEPSVALIIYNHDKHVDKKGLPCHGPMDQKAIGTRAMFAPYISDELRLQIMSLLYVGVPVETIMQRHTEMVERQGGPSNRDDLLTHRYVRRLERKIRRSSFELDADDAISIGMWVENYQNHIFFYEDFSDSDTFVLGIQTEWQLQQMIQFGNRSLMASDSKFGTNKLKYPIYSLLVFDSQNNAIPVAWVITPNFANGEMHRWMGALYDRVHSKDPTWQLGGFIVDDPLADLLTIRDVFQCSILISFWRVRHLWHKNLIEKCSELDVCAAMARQLGGAVSNICRGSGNLDSFKSFLEEFVDWPDFLDYFTAVWIPRIGAWITALKTLPVASTEVAAAIESYHHLLKLRLLNEKDTSLYQRADWLVDKLGTKVHSFYWLDEYSGKDNFSRYWKDEWKSGVTSWREGLQIPDSDVTIEGKCAKVVCKRNREKTHIVRNPGSEFALCDCNWSMMGNICKHVIKSTKVYRDRGLAAPSTSLLQYNQILMNILHCPPYDSLLRDYAVALAVCGRTQLNTFHDDISNGCSASTASIHREQPTGNELRSSASDRNEIHQVIETSTELSLTKLQMDSNTAVEGKSTENESENSLDRSKDSESAVADQVADDVVASEQVSDGCHKDSETERPMDIDSHRSQVTAASNGVAAEQCTDGVAVEQCMDGVTVEESTDGVAAEQCTDAPSSDKGTSGTSDTQLEPMVVETAEMQTGLHEGDDKKINEDSVKNVDTEQSDKVSSNIKVDNIIPENVSAAGPTVEVGIVGEDRVADLTSILDSNNANRDISPTSEVGDFMELDGDNSLPSEETTHTMQLTADCLKAKRSSDNHDDVMDAQTSSDCCNEASGIDEKGVEVVNGATPGNGEIPNNGHPVNDGSLIRCSTVG